jgi:tetratricopeptide (TPR) repeat protein
MLATVVSHSGKSLRPLRGIASQASSGDVIDDIVTFVRQASQVRCISVGFTPSKSLAVTLFFHRFRFAHCAHRMQGDYTEAMNVLRTGVRSKPGPVGLCRLRMVEAELQAAQGQWGEVVDLTRSIMSLASETSASLDASLVQDDIRANAEVELAASTLGTRALLTSGRDADAFQMAQQSLEIARKSFSHAVSEDKRWQAMVLSTSLAGLVQHASCELESAADSFESVQGLIGNGTPKTALDYLIPEALKQTASFSSAQGRKKQTVDLGMRSIAAAEHRREMAGNGLDLMLSPKAAEEIVADAKLLMSQTCMQRNAWEEAEEKLNEALEVIESIGTKSILGMGLLPLAEVYGRTSRVTLAEGMYREITKLLDLDPREEKRGTSDVHPSVNSLVAWRFSQLLTVLPKRETEATAWKNLSHDIYDKAPLKRLTDPEMMFGSLERLSGQGISGRGVVLDLMTRRCLPRFETL